MRVQASLLLMVSLVGCGDDQEDLTSQFTIKGGSIAKDYPSACLIDIYDASYKQRLAFCSGALIAPGVVLTAGHCVYTNNAAHVICPFVNQDARGRGVPHPTYHPGVNGSVDPNSDDVGVILLNNRMAMTQYPAVRKTPTPINTLVVNVGRVLDGAASQTTLYKSAEISLQDGKLVKFPRSYAAKDKIQPGDSGGPTYLGGATGALEVVAVNSGVNEKEGYEVLSRVDLVYSWINGQVESWGGWSLPPGYQPITPQPLNPTRQ